MLYLEGVDELSQGRQDDLSSSRRSRRKSPASPVTNSTSATGTSQSMSQHIVMNDEILMKPLHEIDEEIDSNDNDDDTNEYHDFASNQHLYARSSGNCEHKRNSMETAKSYHSRVSATNTFKLRAARTSNRSLMSNHSHSTQNSSVSHSSKRSEMMRRKKSLNHLIRGTSGRSIMLFEGNSDTNSCVESIDPPEDGTLGNRTAAPKESKFYGWGEDDSCYTESEPEPIRKDEDSVELYVAFPEKDQREASIAESSLISQNEEGTMTDVMMDDEFDSKRPWRKAPTAAKRSSLPSETGNSSMNRSFSGDNGTILEGKSKYVEEQSKQTMSSLSSESRKRIIKNQIEQVKNKPKIGTVITTDENTKRHYLRERFLEQEHKSGSDISEVIEATDALKRSQAALAGTIRRNNSFSSNSQRSHRTIDTNYTNSSPIYRKPEPFRPGPAFERKFTQTNRMISLGSFGQQYSCSTLGTHGTRQSLTIGNQQSSFMALEEGDERDEDEDDEVMVSPDTYSSRESQIFNGEGKEAFLSNGSRHSLSLHSLEEIEGVPSTRRSIASTTFSIDEESSMERFRSSRRQSRVSLTSLNSIEGSETFSATRRPSRLSMSSFSVLEGPVAFRSSEVSKDSFASDTNEDGLEEFPSVGENKSNDIENPEVKENDALKEAPRKKELDASNRPSDLQKVDEVEAENNWDASSNATNNTSLKQDAIVTKDDASNENSYEGGLDLLGQNRAEERNKLMAISHMMFPSDSDVGSKGTDENDPSNNTALRRSQMRLRRRSLSSLSGVNESIKRATTVFKRSCFRNRIGFSLAMLITVIILLAVILGMVLYNRMYNSNLPTLPPTSNEQVTASPSRNPKSQKVDETIIIFQPIDSKPTSLPTYLPTKSSQPSQSHAPTLSPTTTASPTITISPTTTTSQAPTTTTSQAPITTTSQAPTLSPITTNAPSTTSSSIMTAPPVTGNTTKVSNQTDPFTLTNETISSEYDVLDQDYIKELDQIIPESNLALESKNYDPQETRTHLRSPSPNVFTMWPTPVDTYTMVYPPPPNKKDLREQIDHL